MPSPENPDPDPLPTCSAEQPPTPPPGAIELEARLKSLERRIGEAEEAAQPQVEKKKDSSPLLLTILGAIATGLFAIWNSFVQAKNAHQLEQDKLQSTIVLKAIEPSDPEERKKALLFYVEVGLLADPDGKIAKLKPENIPQSTTGTRLRTIGASDIVRLGEAIVFSSGLMVNVDGAPRAYHPDGAPGLDYLGNAGKPGNWWALITDNGKPSGNPVIQGPKDPAPGFYISWTSLQDASKDRTDPRRYVDSSEVSYINIPARFTADTGVKLGDIAAVYCDQTQKLDFAVVADLGPRNKIGEGSIALAARLGLRSDPKNGGTAKGVTYVVFPQTGKKWPMTAQEIKQAGEELFRAWGGLARIKTVNSSPSPTAQANPPASATPINKPVSTLPGPNNKNAKGQNDIDARLRNIIVEQLGVTPEQVVPSARFQADLGADSLDLVELVMAAEEEFQIEIPDDDAEQIQTVADARAYIAAHIKQ